MRSGGGIGTSVRRRPQHARARAAPQSARRATNSTDVPDTSAISRAASAVGLAAALAAVGGAAFSVLSSQPSLPPLGDALGALAAGGGVLAGGAAAAAVATKVVLGDRFRVELHRWGRELPAPSMCAWIVVERCAWFEACVCVPVLACVCACV
jgi:hypothetical protein